MKIFTTVTDPEVIERLKNGEVGVLPTDTIYGIVALAASPRSVARLYDAKHRKNKPGTVILANVAQLYDLGVNPAYIDQVKHLWPNSLSIKLPIGPELGYLQPGSQDGAFRVVNHPEVKKLLEQTGPLLTSSANMPGLPPATNLTQAREYFGDAVDFYVDAGDIGDRPPSTIVRLAENGELELIRPGAVTISEGKTV